MQRNDCGVYDIIQKTLKEDNDMKKIIMLIAAILLCVGVMSGCSDNSGNESNVNDNTGYSRTEIRLGGLKGPTSMGMVKLIDDAEKDLTENSYEYTMAVTADELTPKFLKGELDILAVPANLGSVLYNNSDGEVRVIAVNTLGVIYIVEKGGNDINSIADLKGRTLLATGKSTTPEYALRYLAEQYGLDPDNDITVEWKSEPTEIIAQMSSEEHSIAMIPQPFASAAQSQLSDLRIAVDMTKAWDELGNGSQFITAVLIVRKQFAEEHPDAVGKFLEEYKKSADYVNSNLSDAAVLIEKAGIVKAPVAEKAIPYCNLVCITGNEMKQSLSGYLGVLYGQNPKSVGGKLPSDDYYLTIE